MRMGRHATDQPIPGRTSAQLGRFPGVVGRIILGATVAALFLVGCSTLTGVRGSGDVVSETREVSDFDGVDLSGEGHVTITIGDEFSLVISAEDNIMPLLTSEVSDGVLVLGTSESISPTEEIDYEVTLPLVSLLEVSGSGRIDASGVVAEDLGLDVSGSGALQAEDISVTSLQAEVSGSGQVGVSGETDHVQVSISGSGALEGENLIARTGVVNVSGSGSVVVGVTDDLEVDVSGSGSVEYIGNPPSLDVDVSGSGDVSGR